MTWSNYPRKWIHLLSPSHGDSLELQCWGTKRMMKKNEDNLPSSPKDPAEMGNQTLLSVWATRGMDRFLSIASCLGSQPGEHGCLECSGAGDRRDRLGISRKELALQTCRQGPGCECGMWMKASCGGEELGEGQSQLPKFNTPASGWEYNAGLFLPLCFAAQW